MPLAIILLAFAALAYYNPKYALGLVLALLPTYLIRFKFGPLPTTFLELILFIFLAITLIKNVRSLPELKKLGTLNWAAGFFVLAGIISALISPDQRSAFGALKAYIVEPVLFFYALKLTLKKPEDLTTPLNMLFIGAIVVSLFGIVQHFTYINLPLKFWGTGEEVQRITSVFGYPNALALYLSPLIAFFFGGFVSKEPMLNRTNLVLGLLAMALALFFTYSRGAWLALLLTIFILFWLKYPKKQAALAALVLIGVVALLPAIRTRLALVARDTSSSARIQLMSAAITEIKSRPLLGNGLSGFRTTLARQNFEGEILNYPHNLFLNFWLETGLAGLISFLAVVFLAINRYKGDSSWYKISALGFMLALLIHGLVDVPYFKNDLSILFWFIIGVFYV